MPPPMVNGALLPATPTLYRRVKGRKEREACCKVSVGGHRNR